MTGSSLNPFSRRNRMAFRNVVSTEPAFWTLGFWRNLKLARQAQQRGAMQKMRELVPLVALLRRRKLDVVVEIGTAHGGTLYAWCMLAGPDALVVSIDLPGGPFGGGYTSEERPIIRGYGNSGQRLHLIRGDSHEDGTLSQLLGILHGKQIDFLMIDGDHTYEGVKRDFEMYAPLVRGGSPIAFHDILQHPADQACEVDRFWEEVKGTSTHVEFLDPYEDRQGRMYGGIGVLFKTGVGDSRP